MIPEMWNRTTFELERGEYIFGTRGDKEILSILRRRISRRPKEPPSRSWNARSKKKSSPSPLERDLLGVSDIIISGIHFLMDEVESPRPARKTGSRMQKQIGDHVKTNQPVDRTQDTWTILGRGVKMRCWAFPIKYIEA